MRKTSLIIGSRGSSLALWQSQWVQQRLQQLQPNLETEVHVIKTTGDAVLDSPLSKIGDKGLFTKELDQALLDGSIDVAVHSLKDVPTVIPDGLTIAAISERENVFDAFVAHPDRGVKRLVDVPKGATIATSSLRRRSQLLNSRPDLRIEDVRGNLDTRIEKLRNSDWAGLVLAVAGLKRLGRQDLISEELPPTIMLPAVGQGALAIETRKDDLSTTSFVKVLDHAPTWISTAAERALLKRLEGGCQIPIGAHGRIEKGVFKLDAMIGSLDGKRVVRASISGKPQESEELGESLAEQLLAAGGKEILGEIVQASR